MAPAGLHHATRPLEQLLPYARNARTHDEEQIALIAGSLVEFGWTNPIIIDGANGIIAGHGRLLAARKVLEAGAPIPRWADPSIAPVIELAHLTEAQKRAYVLADNQLAVRGTGWDADLLGIELAELQSEGFDLSLIGFEDADLAMYLGSEEETTVGLTDEDAVPDVAAEPVSKLGDVWILGKHRVMCGDSTSIDAVESLMQGESAGMVFTDPPYNLEFSGQDLSNTTVGGKKVLGYKSANTKHHSIKNDSLDSGDFKSFITSVLLNLGTLDPKAWYFTFSDLTLDELLTPMRETGFAWKSILVWKKNQASLSGKDYKSRYEPIVYGCKPGAFYGERYKQEDIWEFQRTLKNDLHPTMKPIDLIENALQNSSHKGDSVVDLFGGSGSTLIACEKIGRVGRLMELVPRYVDVIVRRWQAFTGLQATHAATGATFDAITADRSLALAEAA